MVEVTVFRKGGIYETDLTRRVLDNLDTVDGEIQYFRGEVSEGVYNILMKGTLEQHDRQVEKLLQIKQ